MLINFEHASMIRGDRTLWRNVSLTLAAGQAAVISGANGCGKSTLLKTAAGLLPLRRGRCTVRAATGEELPAHERLSGIGYLGHADGVRGALLVSDEAAWEAATGRPQVRQRIIHYGLDRLLHTQAAKLSRGQQRRLALALSTPPRGGVWLLDEPTVGLDAEGEDCFAADAASFLADGGALLAVSHTQLPVKALTQQLTRDGLRACG